MATKKVLESEALSNDISFEFNGEVYSVPPGKKWELDVIEAQEEGRMTTAVRLLIGEDKYKELRKTVKNLEDLDKFYDALFKAVDTDPKFSDG